MTDYSFYEYQRIARATAIYPDNVRLLTTDGSTVALYPFLGLAGEVGEVMEKVKKLVRDSNGVMSEQDRTNLMLELGDIMWYLAACSHELGYNFATIARMNAAKLRARAEYNKLQGSGDDR